MKTATGRNVRKDAGQSRDPYTVPETYLTALEQMHEHVARLRVDGHVVTFHSEMEQAIQNYLNVFGMVASG